MPETVDKLGMAKEWEETPAAEPEKQPEPEVKEFMREIDLGDGSGKQVFKADSYEGLLDKLVEAQTHASKKIRELSQERKRHEPEKVSSDWQELKPAKLDNADLPNIEGFRRMFQAETGVTPGEFIYRENERRKQEAEARAQNDFVQRYTDEYNPTPKNAQKIYRLLQNENLPVSKRNLDWAFDQLRGELEPRQTETTARAPQTEARAPVPPRAAEREQPLSRSTPPSFMRPSVGARDEMAGEGQEAEIARIERSSSLPELKARIEQLHRQQRSSAR